MDNRRRRGSRSLEAVAFFAISYKMKLAERQEGIRVRVGVVIRNDLLSNSVQVSITLK